MFSYIMLGTNDLPRALRFYDPLMELLGYPQGGRGEEGASWHGYSGPAMRSTTNRATPHFL